MSEPLYSSSFTYVKQSLELEQSKEVVDLINNPAQKEATNKTLMDFYSNRITNVSLASVLNDITSFNQFVTNYKVFKGQLTIRQDSESVIVVTYPAVKYISAKVKKILAPHSLKYQDSENLPTF